MPCAEEPDEVDVVTLVVGTVLAINCGLNNPSLALIPFATISNLFSICPNNCFGSSSLTIS